MRSSNKGGLVSADALVSTPAWTPGEFTNAFHVGESMDHRYDMQQVDTAALREQEIEARVQDAYNSGYEEGRLEGEIAEGARLRNAIAVAESALDELRRNEVRWQDNIESNIAALAVAVARHVLGRELTTDATAVAELVRRALAEFPIDQPVRIRVNPIDLNTLSSFSTPTGEPIAIAPNRDVRWQADARMQPGGCVVEGRERIIDGRVDTALERLYRKLSDSNV